MLAHFFMIRDEVNCRVVFWFGFFWVVVVVVVVFLFVCFVLFCLFVAVAVLGPSL